SPDARSRACDRKGASAPFLRAGIRIVCWVRGRIGGGMSLAVLASRALFGLQARAVQVEVHVGSGLPSFSIVGLPGAGVRESRERVRSAILNCGFDFPAGRITANLAPA